MPKVNAGFATFRFDQMATLINDRVDKPAESRVERYVGLEHLDADSLRIRRWGEITDVESTKLRFQSGDIILGKRRVYQRKLAVAEFEGICSAHAMVLRANASVVLPEFLPFFMQSDRFMERALAISVGSLSPTINWTTLAAEEFALPPLEEQRRIAETLVELESCGRAVFDLGLSVSRLVLSFSRSQISQLRDTGEDDKQLSEVADVITGRTPMTSRKEYWGETMPFATPGDMGYVEPSLDSCERGLTALGAEHSQVVPEGSSLVVCIGSTIGKVARCARPVAFNQQINAVVPHGMDSMYLFMTLLDCGSQLARRRATTAVPIVNKSEFSSIRIPVPKSSVQNRIGRQFTDLLRASEQCGKRREDLAKFKNRLLAAAIGGQS